MAERRMISKSISISERVNDMSIFARLLFTWMIPHADDFGRLPGSPMKLRALVVPMGDETKQEVEDALHEMDQHHLIQWYTIAGTRYIQINGFEKHQSGIHKRTQSRYPGPEEADAPTSSTESSQQFLEVADSSGISQPFPELPDSPGNSQQFPEIPGSSQRFPEIPGSSQRFPEVPGNSQHFQEIPGSSQPFPEVPGNSQHFQEIPGSSQPFPEIPGNSQHFQEVPGISGIYRHEEKRTEKNRKELQPPPAPSSDGQVENSISNKELISELVSSYRKVKHVKPLKGDYSFMGRLYNRYGYEDCYAAIDTLSMKLERAPIDDPLLYLQGILKNTKVIPLRLGEEPSIRFNQPSEQEIKKQQQLEEEMLQLMQARQNQRKEVTHGVVARL
jgi:hypothetical protein